jgi:predicted DNA-binding ribbon-helix-helix protein
LEKRSLTLAGHRTSVSLEPEFWAALEQMAALRGISLSALVREIDAGRAGANLSSSLRLAALRWHRDQARKGSATPGD